MHQASVKITADATIHSAERFKENQEDWKMDDCTELALQMFAGIYRDFAGKSECRDFKFTGIACIPAIPVIFEVNQKKSVDFLYIHFIKIFQISL